MEIIEMFYSLFDSVIYIFENYGWYLLIFIIISAVLYDRKLRLYLEKYRKYRFEQEYSAKYHKNPDLFSIRVAEQQSYAAKLQEQYDKAAEEYKKKQEEKKAKKQEELANKYVGESGSMLGSSSSKNDSKQNTFKSDYNPLMGHGSSSSYRPPKKSKCGGGGCGK